MAKIGCKRILQLAEVSEAFVLEVGIYQDLTMTHASFFERMYVGAWHIVTNLASLRVSATPRQHTGFAARTGPADPLLAIGHCSFV